MSCWYKEQVTDNGTVVSTRVRLARNLSGVPFAGRMTPEARQSVCQQVKNAILESDTPFAKSLRYISMEDVPEHEAAAMVERHIISPAFAKERTGRAIIISQDETVCVMIGEEDHIRIQVIMGGLCLEKAYDLANQIDDLLGSKLNYAYDEQLGYLTECPTNLGTGMRASVMMHLPFTAQNGTLREITDAVGKIGFTVRGLYGEGSSAVGDLYQISNQITLGITEKNAIDNLLLIVRQIGEKEEKGRQECDSIHIGDLVWRAYGTLKYARRLSSQEMMELLSRIKIGEQMGILNTKEKNAVQLMVEGQPAMLCRTGGEKTPEERDVFRAEWMRQTI